jgi:hypothetical protein
LRRGRIAVDIEFRGGRDVAGDVDRPADDDDLADESRQFGIALKCPGDICQWSQGDDRHLVRRGPHYIANHLLGWQNVLPFGDGEFNAAQTIDAVKISPFDGQAILRLGSGTQTRPARRIELFQNHLHIAGGLARRDVTAYGRDRDHIQIRLKKRQAHRQRVVDARIYVQNHLPGHVNLDKRSFLPGPKCRHEPHDHAPSTPILRGGQLGCKGGTWGVLPVPFN